MKRVSAQRKVHKKGKSVVNRSTRRKVYKVALVSSVFFVSLLFLFSYGFYRYLNQNFASALTNSSYSLSEDNMPTMSFIIAEDLKSDPVVVKKVNFIIFDKTDKKVSIYNIPTDRGYSIPGKYGSEQFSKIFALGGMNSDNKLLAGSRAVNRALFKLFGFKVDKFLLVDSSHEEFFDKLFHNGGLLNLVNIKDISGLGDSLVTDIDLREFYKLTSFVYSLPEDRVIDEVNGPNCFCNTQEFDDYIRESTYESDISKEKKNIAILNGTNYSGLASFGARVVSNIGGRVVAVDNTDKFYDQSVIITDDINSKTAAFLSRVFNISTIIPKEESHSFIETEIDRSDVSVIFGFDTSGDLY